MKKILIIVIVTIFVIIIFYPKKVYLGGGYPVVGEIQNYQKCYGLYWEEYNENAHDGGRGGQCFGIVIQKSNIVY